MSACNESKQILQCKYTDFFWHLQPIRETKTRYFFAKLSIFAELYLKQHSTDIIDRRTGYRRQATRLISHIQRAEECKDKRLLKFDDLTLRDSDFTLAQRLDALNEIDIKCPAAGDEHFLFCSVVDNNFNIYSNIISCRYPITW